MNARTNPIGAGTANITYNAPSEESAILNRLAFEMNIPRAELLRDVVLRGLQMISTEVAKNVEAVREERQRIKHGLVHLVLLLCTLSSFCVGTLQARRPKGGTRTTMVRKVSRRGKQDFGSFEFPEGVTV